MNIKIAIIVMATILLSTSLFAESAKPKKSTSSTWKSFIHSHFNPQKSIEYWIFKIDDVPISARQFQRGYNSYLDQLDDSQKKEMKNNNIYKKQFFDNFLNQEVVIRKAMEKDFFADPDVDALIDVAMRDAIYKIYLLKQMPSSSKFEPNDVEINNYYRLHQQQISQMSLNTAQIKELIKSELRKKKAEIWLAEYVQKLKEEYKIKRNDTTMKKLGLE